MKTKVIADKEGRPFAFEVNNAFLTRFDVRSAFRTVPGASGVRRLPGEEFCEVQLNGKCFVAWEPFGDNSVYWIGPNPLEWNSDIAIVREAFQRFRPFWGIVKWVPIVAAFVATGIRIWTRHS